MNDCVNAEIRDQLPELLHGRLDASAGAAVMAHVGECADCRAELELLRSAREMLVARTPRVDVNYVVQALPKAAAPGVRPASRRHVWADWRVAAAVTLLIAGGSSVALLNRGPSAVTPSSATSATTLPLVQAPAVPPAVPPAVGTAPETASTSVTPDQTAARQTSTGSDQAVASADEPAPTAEAGNNARLGDLDAQQLQSLLEDIDKLQPVPVTEPEPVSLRVTSTTSSSEGA